jgi:hypothetical protein
MKSKINRAAENRVRGMIVRGIIAIPLTIISLTVRLRLAAGCSAVKNNL